MREFERGYELSGGAPRMLGALGHGYALWGKRQEARDALAKLMELRLERYVSPFEMALIHLGLGDRLKSFEWLRKVCEVRSYEIIFLRTDPRYDPLPAGQAVPRRCWSRSGCNIGHDPAAVFLVVAVRAEPTVSGAAPLRWRETASDRVQDSVKD